MEKFITHRSGGAILDTSRGHVRRLRQVPGRDLRAGPGVHAFISVPQWNALGFWVKAILVNSNQTQQGFGKLLGVCGGSYLKGFQREGPGRWGRIYQEPTFACDSVGSYLGRS